MKIVASFLAAVLIAAIAPAWATDWSGDGGMPAFYHWDKNLPVKPGVMLQTAPLPKELSLPAAAKAYRILYSSTGWPDGKPVAVSGALFIPAGKAPKGGWPLIAWAHGTTGYADVCAPSNLPRSDRDSVYLSKWLEDGYAIVATDYQGLGTKGPHPYLQYRSEGMAVLDSVRAVQRTHPELSRKVLTMGQSQGSGAAIGAAYIAPHYAPELKIMGTVATGIVAEAANSHGAPQQALASTYTDENDYSNAGFEVLYFLGTVRSSDPVHIRPEDYISDKALPLLAQGEHMCLHDLFAESTRRKITMAEFYRRPLADVEAFAAKTSRFPDGKLKTPVFVGTGLADTMAQTGSQYNFVSAMCAAGTTVQWHYYPHATHGGAVLRSRADSPAFVKAVMGGKSVQNMCASLVPPGPLQTPED